MRQPAANVTKRYGLFLTHVKIETLMCMNIYHTISRASVCVYVCIYIHEAEMNYTTV